MFNVPQTTRSRWDITLNTILEAKKIQEILRFYQLIVLIIENIFLDVKAFGKCFDSNTDGVHCVKLCALSISLKV